MSSSSVYERYKNKKDKKSDVSSQEYNSSNGVLDRYKQNKAKQGIANISTKLSGLSSSRDELYNSYRTRFIGDDGNFVNAYRGDTRDALTSFESSKARIDSESKSILDSLSTYEKYLDADTVKSIRDYLSSYNNDLDGMYKTYQNDHNYFSQWEDEDTYKRAISYAKEQADKKTKYSSMSDDELDAEIKRLEDSKKGNKFTNFAMKYIGTPGVAGSSNLYAKGEANQDYNDAVDFDISLIEKEKTNRKYKQIDALPGDVKSLVDELTEIEATNKEQKFSDAIGSMMTAFGQPSQNNSYSSNDLEKHNRYNEIIKELEAKGVENWQELVAYNTFRYNEEKNAPVKEMYGQMAKEHPVLSSAISIPASLSKGFGVLEMIENVGSDVPLDPNSPYFAANNLSNTVRETVMDERDFHLNTGNETIDNIDIFDELYSTGMSMGDSLMAGVGLAVGGGFALGLSAASDSAQEVAEKGGSASEAIVTGLVSGVNEMLWESLSLGKLNDLLTNGVSQRGFKGFVKETLKSMGINASEELNTEAANLLADYLINGGASTYSEAVQTYLSLGYSNDEAKSMAKKDMLVQIGKAGIGGALQGLFMGGGASGISTAATGIENKVYENKFYNQAGQNIVDNNNLSQLVEQANGLGSEKSLKALKDLADKVSGVKTEELDTKGNKKYAHQVGKLYKGVTEAQLKSLAKSNETAFRNVIKDELDSAGVDNVDEATEILVKAMYNQGLTRAESQKFQSFNGREILNKALNSAEFKEKRVSEEEKQESASKKRFVETYTLPVDKSNKTKLDELTDTEGYKISTNGKTTIDATDEEVKINKITSFDKNDDVSVELDTGVNLSVSELNIDENTVVIFNGLKKLNAEGLIDVDTANYIMAMASKGNVKMPDFIIGAMDSIRYGSIGYEGVLEKDAFTKGIPVDIRKDLFDRGKKFSEQKAENKAKTLEKQRQERFDSGKGKIRASGNVKFDGVKYKDLNSSQKAQVDLLEVVFSEMGINLEFFASPVVNGVRTGENGSYNPRTNTIRLDVFAGNKGEGLMLFTAAHELTHFIREWSPAKFKAFADFLIKRYAENDISVKSLINAKISDAETKGRTMTFDEAYEEVVADACESFLRDSNAKDALVALAQVDESLSEKIIRWIKDFVKLIENAINALNGKNPESKESQYVLNELKGDLSKLHDLWDEALLDARENAQWVESSKTAQKNTTDEGDVKQSQRKEAPILSNSDVKAAQSIGRKSINALSSSELNILSVFAKKYWKELGTKSPFFRAWFGDWRENDTTPITVATKKSLPRGKFTNTDTGWVINIPGKAKNETTKHKSKAATFAVPYLDYLEDITKNAILLESFGSDKGGDALLMHSFYAVADIGNGREVLKLYVQELYNVNSEDTTKRTYMLQNITKQSGSSGSQNKSVSHVTPTAVRNVADLFAFVKQYDKNFSPKPASKIVNADGTPKVMYHGTHNDFTAFDKKKTKSYGYYGRGFYFTDSESHSKQYGKSMAEYLDVKNPLEQGKNTISKKQLRDFLEAVAENEDYDIWNYGTEDISKIVDSIYKNDAFLVIQDVNATAIGDFAEAIALFNKVNGTSYDGVITPTETVVYEPTQIKSATDNIGTFDGGNSDTKFSLRENVEETKELVAVHNLSEEKLLKSLKLGGLPMPSIAIIKAKNGHNNFGDISLVFDKSSIDPKLSKYNKVFTSDAYTPTYPHIDYKIDSEVIEKGVDEVERLIRSKGYGKDDFGYLSSISGDNFRYGNTEEIANKTALKVAYLIDKGIDFTPIYEEKQHSGFGRFDNEAIKYIADAIGKERINELHNNSEGVKKALEEIRNLASEQKAEKYKEKESLFKSLKERPFYGDNNFGFAQAHEIVEGAYNYFNNGTQTEIDEWQTGREIANLIDNADYKKWVDNLFNGFIEKEGIRNNADLFTPSGNRRSFEALHWEHNLENVIKSMRTGLQQGNALFGSSIYGASQAELKSIADIKSESDRLVNVDSEESKATYREKRKDLELRFTELVSSIVRDNGNNVFIAMDDASAVLVESVLKCKTKTAMDNYIKRELEGWGNYSNTLADDLMDIVKELRALPTGYFEAKPQRAVMFDEVKAVVVPDNSSQELREQLNSMGINVLIYEHGNDNSRTEVLNSIEDVKFQDRVTPAQDAEYLELAKNPEKNEARLREMVDSVARANGYTIRAYHGTPSNDFTTFDTKKIGSNTDVGIFGSGFYFTTHKDTAGVYATESGHTMSVYLRVNNPWWAVSRRNIQDVAEELGMDEAALTLRGYGGKGRIVTPTMSQTGQFSAHLQEHGYDAVVVQHGSNNYEIVVFDSNAIKSSEPVTYDDNGNIIPLSERFNEGNDDIRYQDRPYQPSPEELGIDYKEENDKLKADVERLKEMMKLQKTLTHGALFTKTSVEKAASLIMREFDLHRGKSDLAEKLNALYTFIASSDELTWDEIYDRASQIANWIIDSKPEKFNYKNPYASDILKDIRERGVTFNEKQKEEAAYSAGSFNAYRKMNIGNFKIVNEGGIPLTDLWEQLVNDYPGAINQESIEKGKIDTNLPSLIVELIEDMRQTESVLEQMDRTQEVRKMVEKIYDTYWNVTTLHTLADKHQKEINLLKGKHRAEMDALKEKTDTKVKNTQEHYREMLQKVRADKNAKMEAYKEHVQEQKKKNVEGRHKTATKNKIKRVIKTLESLYSNPTKERNVKIEFQDMVAKALVMADVIFNDGNISSTDILSGEITIDVTDKERKLIDEWKKTQEARQGYQDRLDAMEASNNVNPKTHDELLDMISRCNNKLNRLGRQLSGVVERQKANLNNTAVKSAIDSLAKAYRSLNESTEGYAKAAYNEYVDKRLTALQDALDGVTAKTITQAQLDELYQAYKMVLTTVRTANEIFVKNKKMSVTDMGEAVITEVEKVAKPTDDKIAALREIRKFSWEELKPIYAFERIGSSTFMELFTEARRGEDVLAMDVADARNFFNGKNKAYGYDSWDFDERKEFRLADGRTFSISLEEIMSIYAYSKREQALDHMTKGGFVFDNKEFFTDTKEKGLKGKIKRERTTVEAYRLNDDVFYKIINSLTKEQKQFVDDMQEYLSSVMGAKGNEVSRILYGIDLFKEKFYFPLMSSHDFIQQTNNPAGEVALKNSGMAKSTVPHARNPIVLKGFMDVWSEHVNKMSTYHALVLPIENLNKVFNYTGYARDNKSVSVQTILAGAYGQAVNDYISNFITDLNGGVKVQSSGNLLIKGISLFKKTAVAASTSVIVQQPTAVIRAMAMLDGKYFVHGTDGLKHNEAWEELKKYAPVAILKEMGGFDVGSGRMVADFITSKSYEGVKEKAKGFFTDSAYRDEALMWGASKADEIGWITIWNAVKKEIADTTTYKFGSEEFLQACGERFTEVVAYTQVYDSVLSRSGFMRNKGEISKMATAFMGEPTTSFNMLYNAVLQRKRGNISKGDTAKIIGATLTSIIAAAIAKSFIYALRDDDEDEAYVEKYTQALVGSLKEDLFIPNMLPYVSDITSLLQGWEVERTDMAVIKDIKDAFDGLDSSSKSGYRKAEDLIGAIASVFGIPAKNLMRTGREMFNLFENIFDDDTLATSDVGNAAYEGVFGEITASDMNEQLNKGNTDKAKETMQKLISEKVESGKTEKEAKSALKSSVTSYWKPLYLEAYRDGDTDEMYRIRKLLASLGLYDSTADTCSNWIKSSKTK